jgi:hypothetical protein
MPSFDQANSVKSFNPFWPSKSPRRRTSRPKGGQRGGIIVVNVSDVSQIPALAEPWFLTANAKVEFIPAMTPEDLAKAGPSIEAAIKKYAS